MCRCFGIHFDATAAKRALIVVLCACFLLTFTTSGSGQSGPNHKVVVLNFDDVSTSQIRYVKPILDQYGYKATFFPVCDWVDTTKAWDEIEALHRDGMDIQSHTLTHPVLSELSETQLENEIALSQQCLLEHGINATIFAYPFGAGMQNKTVVDIVAKYYDLARGATYCCPKDGVSNILDSRYSVNSWVQLHITGPYDYSSYTCISDDCQSLDNSQIFEEFVKIVNDQQIDSDGRIKGVPIIVYHGFVPYDNIEVSKIPTDTSVSLFQQEMKYLHDNGFEVLDLRDLLNDTRINFSSADTDLH